MTDDENKPAPVEVVLPPEDIVEVDLEAKDKKVKEPVAEIKAEEKAPEVETSRKQEPDEREKALQELRRQYEFQKSVAEAERNARKAAEDYARQQAYQVNNARNEVQDSNLKVIMNAIDATSQAAENAERDYATAMAAGDYALAARAQRMMAQAESHLLQLNNGKNKLEEMLQQNTAEGAVREPEIPNFEPQIPRDPVEQYAAKLAPKSAQWLREHPDAVNKIGKLSRAHQDAMEDGIPAESPEYFRYIESRLGYDSQPAYHNDPEPEPVPVQRQATSHKRPDMSAPVTSSASSISPRSSSPTSMVLDSEQVEFALMAFPDLPRDKAIESYARNRAALIREGKLS
jgi:hypothetical protein